MRVRPGLTMSNSPLRTRQRAGLRRALLTWFRKNARDLPWRRTKDPYAVWLSEIILQQTRVEQGLPYFQRFLKAFPTVHALASASPERVLKLWEGLGYYSRARNLHKTAKIVAREFGGVFPSTSKDLQALPGIGRYTAAAIASIAYGRRAAVLDGNVMRVLSRLFDVDACVDEGKVRALLWEMAEDLVPRASPGDFNQAIMELGARVCTPKSPQCACCPVRAYCTARVRGVQESRPLRKSRKPAPHHQMVAGVVHRDGKYLLVRRPENGLLGGLWEFPNGRVRKGETHRAALARVMRECLGASATVGERVATVGHAYSHFTITMNVYRCVISAKDFGADAGVTFKWVTRAQFRRHAFPKSHHKFLHVIR